jgi:hypothetical protein
MQRTLNNQLFKDTMNRKPKRLSFDTTNSHSNIYDWLQTILTDSMILIPCSSCSEFALSNWPATGFTRNGVKQWLEGKNIKNLMILSMVLVHLKHIISVHHKFELKYRAI